MEVRYTQSFALPASRCGEDGKLTLHGIFDLFMDIATLHAHRLDIGLETIGKQNLFWLAVKVKVRLYRRPAMLEPVELTTWPEKSGKLRSCRDYVLTVNGETVAEGKTEWAVINMDTKRLTPLTEVFSPELWEALGEETVFPEPFARIPDRFAPEDEWARYTVRSTDIDVGRHMNNAAYPRAVFGAFSNEELAALKVREMEFQYRTPCYEGDELSFRRKKTETGWELCAARPDGSTALLGKIDGE